MKTYLTLLIKKNIISLIFSLVFCNNLYASQAKKPELNITKPLYDETQELVRGNGAEIISVDPHQAEGIPDFRVLLDLFEGLVGINQSGEVVPAIAEKAEHVVMIQRSPTYVVSGPSEDVINKFLRRILPERITYFLIRWKNILYQSFTFFMARKYPERTKNKILDLAKNEIGVENVNQHFTPSYKPWDQRICLVPDSDLFNAINNKKASVVTDTINEFRQDGILLDSGKKIEADIIITATGIELNSLNDINVTIDDIKVIANERLTYKGMMLSGVPNFAISFGYVNASWTLRADLTCEYVCRLINLMDKKGVKCCEPIDDKSAYGDDQLIDFTSGYFERGLNQMPKQGNKSPWKNYQNYLKDIFAVRLFSIKDSNLNFYSSKE